MKKGMLSRPIKDEKGQVLIYVLILVLLCGLILPPLLAYMASGVKIVKAVHEERMIEFYAADAGIENAIWQLQDGGLTVPSTYNFTLNNVNGIDVINVTIENKGNEGYKVTSVANNTTIEAYVNIADFSGILDNAITSRGNIPPKPGTTIYGQYCLPDSGDTFAIYGGTEAEQSKPGLPVSINVNPGQFSLPYAFDEFTIYGGSDPDTGQINLDSGSISVSTFGNATWDENTGTWTTQYASDSLRVRATANGTHGSWTYSSITTEYSITLDVSGEATIWGGSIVVIATEGATINGTDYWEGTAGESAPWTTPAGGGIITIEAWSDMTQGSFTYTCTTTEFYVLTATDDDGDADVRGVSVDYYSEGDGDWPSDIWFTRYYLKQVDTSNPYPSGTIIDAAGKDLSIGDPDPNVLGLYIDGDLVIKNSGAAGATITLYDTIFVTGDLNIGYQTGGRVFDLDLNNQTIFVQSSSTGNGHEAIKIGSLCNINGSGCIIALGDIYYGPNASSTYPDYVLVMSILGGVNLQPNASFYGSIAGNTIVEIQPNGRFEWMDWTLLEEPLNFPGMVPEFMIVSWKIIINPS